MRSVASYACRAFVAAVGDTLGERSRVARCDALRCGCFSRCKQMPQVYLVRVRMCTGHQAAVAVSLQTFPVAVAVTVAVNAGDRERAAQSCASCGTRQRNAWNAWAKLGLLESPNIGAVQRACQHLMVIAAKRFSMLACKNINIFNLCYILTDSYRAGYRRPHESYTYVVGACRATRRTSASLIQLQDKLQGLAGTSSKRRLSQIHRPLHSYLQEEERCFLIMPQIHTL